MKVNDRVRKNRAHLQEQCRGRLEVWIGVPLIEQVREMARLKNVPAWSAVENALEAHLEEYRQMLIDGRRLSDERACVLKLAETSEYQHQIIEYNRQLAAYNERLCRFQGATHPDEVRVR